MERPDDHFMPKPGFIRQKLRPWVEARKRYHLSHAQVQKARELVLNPKESGRLANSDQELWKLPLPRYIEALYRKRFGQDAPEDVRSIEETEATKRGKKAARRKTKLET